MRRWYTLVVGFVVFIWLMTENTQVVTVTVLGAVLTAIVAGERFERWQRCQRRRDRQLAGWQATLAGGLFAGMVILVTVTLMFVKSAVHSHLFFDYPVEVMGQMLLRLPPAMLAGSLIAGGAWLCLRALSSATAK